MRLSDNQGTRAEFDTDTFDTAGDTAGCTGIVRDMLAVDTAETEVDRAVRHTVSEHLAEVSSLVGLAAQSLSVVMVYSHCLEQILKHQEWWHCPARSFA